MITNNTIASPMKILSVRDFRKHQAQADDCTCVFNNPPPSLQTHAEEILKILPVAQDIVKTYPKESHRLVALGRSPLMLLETVKALKNGMGFTQISCSELREIDAYSYLLGYDALFYDSNTLFLKQIKAQNLTDYGIGEARRYRSNVLKFKKYLSYKKMDPVSIIKRAEAGKKTVIIDGIASGNSIEFFAKLLNTWAKEQGLETDIKNKVVFHLYDRYKYPRPKLIEDINALGFEIKIIPPNLQLSRLMDSNSHNLGVSQSIKKGRLKDPLKTFHTEAENARSHLSQWYRFVIMDTLNNLGLLRDS